MEVASPIPFPYSQGGTKRRFACSPMIDTTIGVEPTEEFSMADDSTSCHHAFKRRRRLSGDIVDCTSSSGGGLAFPAFSPPVFASYGTPQTKSCVASMKRSRADTPEGNVAGHSQVHQKIVSDLQRLVGHQAAEIERLKSEKAAIESSVAGLKSAHHKADNENRILKKAVTIQQERQINASTELEAARKFKAEAEERIRMLEQMNLTLQYHLQAQQSSTMNTFNQFGPRPPDVF